MAFLDPREQLLAETDAAWQAQQQAAAGRGAAVDAYALPPSGDPAPAQLPPEVGAPPGWEPLTDFTSQSTPRQPGPLSDTEKLERDRAALGGLWGVKQAAKLQNTTPEEIEAAMAKHPTAGAVGQSLNPIKQVEQLWDNSQATTKARERTGASGFMLPAEARNSVFENKPWYEGGGVPRLRTSDGSPAAPAAGTPAVPVPEEKANPNGYGYAPTNPEPVAPRPQPGAGGGTPAKPSDLEQRLTEGFEEERKGLLASEREGRATAQREAAYQDEAVALADARVERQRQRAQAAEDAGIEHERQQKAWIEDLYKSKPDPNRYWKNQSGFQIALHALSAALGGVGSALTGGPNVGLKMIEDEISRDVDAQKQEYENKKTAISLASNLYAQALRRLGDPETARLAAEQGLREGLKARVLGDAARSSDPALLARSQALLGQLDQRQVAATAELRGRVQHLEMGRMQLQAAMGAAAARAAGAGPLGKDELEVEGIRVRARDKEDAKLLSDAYSSFKTLRQAVREAKELAKQWGSSSAKTEAGAAYKLKLDVITNLLNKSMGINAVMHEGQRELYKAALGNDTTTPTSATLHALDELQRDLSTNVDNMFSTSGTRIRPSHILAEAEGAPSGRQRRAAAGIPTTPLAPPGDLVSQADAEHKARKSTPQAQDADQLLREKGRR